MIRRRLAALGAAFLLAGALPGCAAVPAVVGVIGAGAVLGRDVYCAGTSGAGKQMARDRLTGGRPLIACPGADTTEAADDDR